MSASPLTFAGSLPSQEADLALRGSLGVRSFRRLLSDVWEGEQERLARLVLAMGVPADRLGDVLHDVYLMAAEKPPGISDCTELVRWLNRVTVNRCHLEHRRRGRWRRLWGTLADSWRGFSGASGIDCVTGGELKADVERALSKLAHADRTLVAMRYFAEMNSREIAEIVGIPESTVRGRLRAARQKLADELASWNDED